MKAKPTSSTQNVSSSAVFAHSATLPFPKDYDGTSISKLHTLMSRSETQTTFAQHSFIRLADESRALPEWMNDSMAGWRKEFSFALPLSTTFFYSGKTGLVYHNYGPQQRANVLFFDTDLNGQDFVIIGDSARNWYALIGAISAYRSLTYLQVHVRQKRFSGITITQPDIDPQHSGEEIIVLEGSDWRDLLIDYAEKALSHIGLPYSPTEFGKNVNGYCSWYYSYAAISEAEFMEAIADLKGHRLSLPIRYAQIDDGYQRNHGDWLVNNSNWPSSQAEVASKLLNEGFTPGIWTMPLLASTSSNVFREHPEWFVKAKTGEILCIPGWSPPPNEVWACLDVSNAEVERHLAQVYSHFYDAGYRYFKLDGLGLSYPEGIRSSQDDTGISALRRALEIIRKAVKESIIVNCGAPYLAALGYVDHSRIGCDTGIRWSATGIVDAAGNRQTQGFCTDPTIPCLFNSITQTIECWWMYDRWFRADPDVLLLRDENTELTFGETRMAAATGIITGICLTSDKASLMSQERLELLYRCATIRMTDVRHVRNGHWELPSVFSGRVNEKPAMLVFNWGDDSKIWDLSDLEFIGPAQEILRPIEVIEKEFSLPPHDAAILVAI